MVAKVLLFQRADPAFKACPTWEEHEWVPDGYYGTGCKKCDIWFPDGGAPWDESGGEGAFYMEECGEEDW